MKVVQCYKPLHPLRFCRSIHNHHFCLFYIDLHSIRLACCIYHLLHFFLFSATNTASSAYLRFVIFTPPNPIPSTPSMASCIINSLYRLKSIGDITQPCLTPLSTPTSLLTSPSHLTAACCRQ